MPEQIQEKVQAGASCEEQPPEELYETACNISMATIDSMLNWRIQLRSFRISEKQSYNQWTLLLWIIVSHLFITITLSLMLNVWIDEAYSLHTTGRDLGYALRQALYFELQPPLYFLVLNLWRNLSSSIFFARLLSILFTAATICVVFHLSSRFLPKWNPAWVAGAFAYNPFVISAASEIRCYALVLLLSALIMLLYYDGYLSEEPSKKARCYYMAISILSLYTYYFLGFLLLANGLTLLGFGRWREFRGYIWGMLIVAALFTPMLFVLPYQTSNHMSGAEHGALLSSLKLVQKAIRGYMLPFGHNFLELLNRWMFHALTVVVLITIVWRRNEFVKKHSLMLISILGVSCFCFILLLNVYSDNFIRSKWHTVVLFLPCLLTAFSLMGLIRNKKLVGSIIMVGVFFWVSALVEAFTRMAKPGDWNRVASHIMRYEKPGEPIVVFINDCVLPFKIYYKGANEIVPIPREPNLERYDLNGSALEDEADVIKAIGGYFRENKEIWIVNLQIDAYLGVDFRREILETFIKRYCALAEEREFYGTEVVYCRVLANGKN